jgi:hypothetical protein
MNRRRQASDPLDAMRRADPVDVAGLRAGMDEGTMAAAMERAIGAAETATSTTTASLSGTSPGAAATDQAVPDGDSGRRPRRRSAPALAFAAVLVTVIATVLVASGVFSGGGAHPSYAEAAIEVAEANPRLLVTAPGWKVTDAGEQFEAEEGQMTFGDGSRTLQLNWYPARYYRHYLHDRAQVSPPRRSRLFGRTATTVDYGTDDYATMLAPMGRVFVEVRGRLGDRAAYESVLRSLRQVDVDTWLAAMPASVVAPDARAPAVAHMLRGLPYPPGFDPSALEGETTVQSHYEVGVRVASAISCGWVESWLAARRSGDADAERAAVEAMAGSHHWPLLLRMEREVPRGWAQNVWTVAAQLRSGHLDQGFGSELVRPDGTGYRLGPDWAVALQCPGVVKREPITPAKPPGAKG